MAYKAVKVIPSNGTDTPQYAKFLLVSFDPPATIHCSKDPAKSRLVMPDGGEWQFSSFIELPRRSIVGLQVIRMLAVVGSVIRPPSFPPFRTDGELLVTITNDDVGTEIIDEFQCLIADSDVIDESIFVE